MRRIEPLDKKYQNKSNITPNKLQIKKPHFIKQINQLLCYQKHYKRELFILWYFNKRRSYIILSFPKHLS